MSSEETEDIIKMDPETMIVTVSDTAAAELGHLQLIELDMAKDVLAELSLTSVQFRDYLVIMNSDFDLIISEEPYHALTLLFDVGSWRYMARIWNSIPELHSASNLTAAKRISHNWAKKLPR